MLLFIVGFIFIVVIHVAILLPPDKTAYVIEHDRITIKTFDWVRATYLFKDIISIRKMGDNEFNRYRFYQKTYFKWGGTMLEIRTKHYYEYIIITPKDPELLLKSFREYQSSNEA